MARRNYIWNSLKLERRERLSADGAALLRSLPPAAVLVGMLFVFGGWFLDVLVFNAEFFTAISAPARFALGATIGLISITALWYRENRRQLRIRRRAAARKNAAQRHPRSAPQ